MACNYKTVLIPSKGVENVQILHTKNNLNLQKSRIFFSLKKETDGWSKKLEMLAKLGLFPARSQFCTHNYFILCAGTDLFWLRVGNVPVLGL